MTKVVTSNKKVKMLSLHIALPKILLIKGNLNPDQQVQYSSFITLSCGSIGMDGIISESCYEAKILQRNYRKMTIISS